MKKRIMAFLLCVSAVLLTASCGRQETPAPTEVSEQPSETAAARTDVAREDDVAEPQTRTGETQTEPLSAAEAAAREDTADTPQNENTGPLFRRFIQDPVKDGAYTISMRQSGITMVTAVSGKDSALDSDMAGVLHFTLIRRGDKYYMVMHGTKKYTEMSQEEYEKQASSFESASVDLQNVRLIDSGEQTIGGKRYSTETYDEGGRGTVTYFFTDTGLARAQVTKDGKTTDVESFTVQDAPQTDLFALPDGYTLVSDPSQLLT